MSTVTPKAQEIISINENTIDAISSLTTTQLLDQDITKLLNGLSHSLQRLREHEFGLATVLPLSSLRCNLVIWIHELAETIKAGRLHQAHKKLQAILKNLRLLLNNINTALWSQNLLAEPSSTYEIPHISVTEDDIPFTHDGFLGQGGFASIDKVKAVCTRGLFHVTYARKRIQVSRRQTINDILNEIKATSRFKHQHIIRVLLTYEVRDEQGERQEFGMVMTPVAEENLKEFLERHDDPRMTLPGVAKEQLQRWFWCLLSGLANIHSKRIRHGDVKPSNILVKNGSVFYTDFGNCRMVDETEIPTTDHTRSKRSPNYGSPEVEDEFSKNLKGDVFSLGCVFMEMTTILCRRRLLDFAKSRGDVGDRAYRFHLDECMMWMQGLRDDIRNESNEKQQVEAWKRVFDLCRMTTKRDKDERCSSAEAFLFWQNSIAANSRELSEIHSTHNATHDFDEACICLNMWE